MADITVNQLTTQTFYQIPQIFMTRTERIKDKTGKVIKKIRYTSDYAQLSNDAKLAYGALYNRCQLSIRSYESGKVDFVDEYGSVFLIFTVEELMELLDKSNKTITKIKKELKQKKLLREEKQGLNKPNRLYLQLVEAEHQIIEEYDSNNCLIKRLDYFGNELPLPKEDLSRETEKTAESLGRQGRVNFTRVENTRTDVENLHTSNTYSSNTENNNDTNRYEKPTNIPLSEISEKEAIKMGDFPFLTDRTIDLLSHFGTDAKKMINKIYAAKRKVEKEYADILTIHFRLLLRLNGELWAQDLEHEVEKFIFKYRTSCHERKPIQDIFAYFYRMMTQFWKLVLLAETVVSFSEIESLRQKLLANELAERSVIQAVFPDKFTLSQLDQELINLRKTVLKCVKEEDNVSKHESKML
ncbi:replication initiator protein A [Enterococcus gallinarum]|uniref:replication initiator protein A n=1 Tax=Enterococcus TaxID=1350 RepID=UPI003F76C573